MNPVESLRSVLCDPEGNVVIDGRDGDREVIRQALEALAAPAEGAQGECNHEWRSGDNSIVQRAVFCIHCQEIRAAKFAGSNEPLIDSAGGAKGEDAYDMMPGPIGNPEAWPPNYADGFNDACQHMLDAMPAEVRARFKGRTPQPAEGDGATLLRTAAEYHYAQAACPRDQFGNTSNHKNPKLEAWHRQIGDAITAALTRPAATAVVPRPSDDELWDQTLRERDDAEKALGDMFQAVTGRPAEWSSAWHYRDAIEEVEDHICTLTAAPAAPKGGVVDAAMVVGIAKKLRKLRLTEVGGRKENSAITVKSCLQAGLGGLYDDEASDYIVRAVLRYRDAALATGEQP